MIRGLYVADGSLETLVSHENTLSNIPNSKNLLIKFEQKFNDR